MQSAGFPGAVTELGRPLSEWRVGTGKIVVLSVLFLVFPGMFVLIGFLGNEPALGFGALGLTALAIGLTYFFLSGLKIVIHENGIERTGRLGKKRVAWVDLESYRLQVVDQAAAAGGAGGALGALIASLVIRVLRKNKALLPQAVIIQGKDGTKLSVPRNLARFEELLASLLPQLVERLTTRLSAAFQRGERIQFGKSLSLQRGIGVTMKGLFGGEQVLRLEELGTARIERAALVIRKVDGSTWKSVPVLQVPNVGVFERFVARDPAAAAADSMPLAWSV
jgi:hypothetical protein